MKINKFQFSIKNPEQNWEIKEVNFDNINLLVGESGAGKTTILRALDLICDVAQGKDRKFGGASWSIEFSHDSKIYYWSLKSATIRAESLDNTSHDFYQSDPLDKFPTEYESDILEESLSIVVDCQNVTVFKRNPSSLEFRNYGIVPKPRKDESVISLFSEEESISPILTAFKLLYFQNDLFQKSMNNSTIIYLLEIDFEDLNSLEDLKKSISDFPFILKAFLIQSHFPEIFNTLKRSFLEIFPRVNDLRVQSKERNKTGYELFFEIQESNSTQWISQSRISAGMIRSLYLLFELFLTPHNSVILIDEFENGLGINCMPQISDLILDYEDHIQFILTSHHPYIINNIPWETWQLVSWEGNKICVKPATEIPELTTSSSLDKFTQLINYWEFQSAQQ
jgi:AAA15 family ATPase/GTPase